MTTREHWLAIAALLLLWLLAAVARHNKPQDAKKPRHGRVWRGDA